MNTSPPQNVRFWSAFHLAVLYLLTMYFVTGCGLLVPPQNDPAVLNLAPERAQFESVLANPKSSKIDKTAARVGIRSIDAAEASFKSKQEGDSILTIVLGIAAALGVPGAAVGAISSRGLGRALAQWKKVGVQTVAGINEAYPNGLPPELKSALKDKQDQDVKMVVKTTLQSSPFITNPGGPITAI